MRKPPNRRAQATGRFPRDDFLFGSVALTHADATRTQRPQTDHGCTGDGYGALGTVREHHIGPRAPHKGPGGSKARRGVLTTQESMASVRRMSGCQGPPIAAIAWRDWPVARGELPWCPLDD